MDHDWSAHFRGERDLGGERGALRVAGRVVVVIVEAALAHRDRGRKQLAQPGDIARLIETGSIVRMDSRGGEHETGITRREFSRTRGGLEGLSDADDRRRARIAGAGDYRVAVAVERRVREVGVAVDED